MKTNVRIEAALQGLYGDEVKAEQQYRSHEAVLRNRGFVKLANQKKEQGDDEAKHRALLGERMALFGMVPLAFAGSPEASIGDEDECEVMLAAEKKLELAAVARYNAGIALCVELNDNDTRDLLAGILHDETEHVHEIETAESLIEIIGLDNFLQAMIDG